MTPGSTNEGSGHPMITIIDYGLGNVLAFVNLCRRIGIKIKIAHAAADLDGAERIILPGVGAFDHAMDLLDASGMRPRIEELVTVRKVPVLGVCVGMQILANGSDEGVREGLGWIPGRVRALRDVLPHNAKLPLPHMGWNDVRPKNGPSLLKGFENDARFYFLHSFYFECANAEHVAGTADYGISFACIVRSGNIYGVQFHPEKSHRFGAGLLKTFSEV